MSLKRGRRFLRTEKLGSWMTYIFIKAKEAGKFQLYSFIYSTELGAHFLFQAWDYMDK